MKKIDKITESTTVCIEVTGSNPTYGTLISRESDVDLDLDVARGRGEKVST